MSTVDLYAGTTQNKEVNINDTFWLYASSHTNVVGVTWTWDTDCFELISNLYATSGQAQFRAKKATPSSGAYIQAQTRYQINGASGSYTDFDDWVIFVKDNTTIDIQSDLTLSVGDSFTMQASVSTNPYDGTFQWQSSNSNVVAIKGTSQSVVLQALSEGYATITVSLLNGAKASCKVTVNRQSSNIAISDYEIINLGLSVNWASKNIGASNEFDYGKKYAWGETISKSNFSASNSSTYNIDIFKSNNIVDGNIGDGLYLNMQHDAAYKNMGENWRMPTFSEFRELINYCSFKLESHNGQYYYLVTGPSGNSIVIPFDYNGWWTTRYWTSSSATNIYEASICAVSKDLPHFWLTTDDRYEGCFVRGVTKEPETGTTEINDLILNEPHFQIIVGSGYIVIKSDVESRYAIYSLEGSLIKSGQTMTNPIYLSRGVYLVSIGNRSSKILVP